MRILKVAPLLAIGVVIWLRGSDVLARIGNATGFGRKPVGPIAKRFFQYDTMHASA